MDIEYGAVREMTTEQRSDCERFRPFDFGTRPGVTRARREEDEIEIEYKGG
jgi:hypothetical protein